MSIKTSDRLRALLDRDAFEGSLVVSRNGLINRAHYARLLGIRPSNLWAYHGDLLREYEAKYGIQTGPLARLSEMRAWLDRAYHTGELKTRNGRVDRLTCIDGARQAHCRSNAVDLSKQKGPDFANADTITCHQCPFAIIQSSQITYAARERETLRKKADNQGSPNQTLFQELERLRLAQLTTAIEEVSNTATPLPAAFRAKDDP